MTARYPRYPGLTPAQAALVDRVNHLEDALDDAERAHISHTRAAAAARLDGDLDRAAAFDDDAVDIGRRCADLECLLELATSDMRAAGIGQPVEPDAGPDLPIGGDQ